MLVSTLRLAALSLLILAAPAALAQGVMFAPGDQVPDIRGFDPENKLEVVDYSKAKFTLINFWATWCEPCKREMPVLEQLHQELGPQGLQIVGVSPDWIEPAEFVEFVEAMNLTYPVFTIGDAYKTKWPGVRGNLPNSFLIDQQGRLVRRYIGASEEQLAALEYDLAAVIAGRPLGPLVMPTADSVVKRGVDKAPKR